MRKHRVAMVGFAHMHINHLGKLFAGHGAVEMAACADTRPARAELREAPHTRGWNVRFAREQLGAKRVYEDWRELLEVERPEIVVCCAENAMHAEVVEGCAGAGAHVVVEKPMASTLGEGVRMARAMRGAGRVLAVNWPILWNPGARMAKKLIDGGEIGRVLQVKWRGAHTGPLGPVARHPGMEVEAEALKEEELAATWWHRRETGGGAFLDYCCYGCWVSRWYIGEPAIGAMGMRGNLNSPWADAEDNGVMLARFPGAMGVYEASWTTWDSGMPGGPIVYGQTGTIVVEEREGRGVVRVERGGGRRKVYEPEPLPEGRGNVAEEVIGHIETGRELHEGLQAGFNLEVMALLDAGVRSCESGRMEGVENGVWE